MIRQRFPAVRVAGIAGWTAMATAWGAFAIARASAPADPPEPPIPAGADTMASVESRAGIPDLPAGGLVVIRTAPGRVTKPEERVVTRVVEQRVVVKAAPSPRSGGS